MVSEDGNIYLQCNSGRLHPHGRMRPAPSTQNPSTCRESWVEVRVKSDGLRNTLGLTRLECASQGLQALWCHDLCRTMSQQTTPPPSHYESTVFASSSTPPLHIFLLIPYRGAQRKHCNDTSVKVLVHNLQLTSLPAWTSPACLPRPLRSHKTPALVTVPEFAMRAFRFQRPFRSS